MRRVGVAFPGRDPENQATWSGTPAGVVDGLRQIGVEAVPLNVGTPPAVRALALNSVALRYLRPDRDLRSTVRRARGSARASPTMSVLDSAFTASGVGESDRLDGIIQIGTGYTLRTAVPIVTYEDMTVAQNRAHPYEQFSLLSERAIRSRIRRQRAVYEQVVGVCVATDWVAESVVDDYSIPDSKVHVVGVGFRPLNIEDQRDWSVPRFLFVGLDWERKNGPAVLRAFAQVRNEHPDAELDLVGGHPPVTQDGVRGHGVLRREVPEERAQVERLFGRSTCFVMPSSLEAAGIVYLEAAAAGLPAIGTSVGGAGFLIGEGGTVVDPSDEGALVAAMRRFADAEVASRTGAGGAARAASFTWNAVAERLVGALDGRSPTRWWDPSESFGSDSA